MQFVGYVKMADIITATTQISICGNFRLKAGPGAGKTEFLINHIKTVLDKSDKLTNARKIACITYTNTAVDNIKKRLGLNSLSQVEVSTIHSFLYMNIIKPYCSFIPEEYGLNWRELDGHDDFIIRKNYVGAWLTELKKAEVNFSKNVNQILSYFYESLTGWLGTLHFSLDDGAWVCDNSVKFDKKIRSKLEPFLIDFKKIYWEKGDLDHNDVLFFSYVLIKTYPFILTVINAKFPYLFIDEFQDTNPIQAEIARMLAEHTQTVVGIIGDEKQSIYEFQGARKEFFMNFPVQKEYEILENHRSTKNIVDFLNEIRTDIKQVSTRNEASGKVVLFIGDKIIAYKKACELCGENCKPVSLSRQNKIVAEMSSIDNKSENVQTEQSIIDILCNDKARGDVIFYIINAIELAKNYEFKEAFSCMRKAYRMVSCNDEKLVSNIHYLLNVYNDYKDKTLKYFYDIVCNNIGFKLTKFKKISDIHDNYEKYTYSQVVSNLRNKLKPNSYHMTIHNAKGDEFNSVFLIGTSVLKEVLLKSRIDTEEQCVSYVGLSRARNHLFIQLDVLTDEERIKLNEKFKDALEIKLI